jgi:hypothetical protein
MNYSTAVMLINANIRAVRGQYDDGHPAEIFKTLDQSLKKDDIVVVESGTRWKYTTVKLVDVDNVTVDFDSDKQMKWVVQKVDTPTHDALKAMEDKAIDVIKAGELRKRREDIRKNTLDAVAAGEIDKLDIAKLSGVSQIEAAKVA